MMSITVIMSVHNCDRFLKEAIDSIINQTFTDFQFLIIDDASSDKSVEIIRSYKDSRIKLIVNENQQGLTKNLNSVIELVKSKYIARMDADDIACKDRLEKQFHFMETHKNIDICGTNAKLIDENGKCIGKKVYPANDDDIKSMMLLTNPIIHPSVMMKTEVLKKFKYDPFFKVSQDYALWARLMKQGCLFANLQESLMKYRVVQKGITCSYSYARKKIYLDQIFKIIYGDLYQELNIEYLQDILYGDDKQSDIDMIKNIMEKIKRQYKFSFVFSKYIFDEIIWRTIVLNNKFSPLHIPLNGYI